MGQSYICNRGLRTYAEKPRTAAFRVSVPVAMAILRTRQILSNRKVGNQVLYSARNPVLLEVLDIMRRYFHSHLTEAVEMLDEIKAS